MKGRIFVTIIVLISFLSGCDKRPLQESAIFSDHNFKQSPIEFSSNFKIYSTEKFQAAEVISPWPGSTDTFNYILSYDMEFLKSVHSNNKTTKILLPLERIVCFSTSHLPLLDMLGESEKLVGFPTTDFVSNKSIRQRIDEGFVQDLGPSNDVNLETLLVLDPDIVFAFSMGNDQSIFNKISQAGIPVVYIADYLENHPLGRAEWIKMISIFFQKYSQSDSIFSSIKNAYLKTKKMAEQQQTKPTVFTGVVYGDTWFMPGGRNYGSVFFKDAGAQYIWENNASGEIMQLSFESVYDKAKNADYWIGTATYNNLREISQADMRYGEFKAFKNGLVFNYSARIRATGGNDYFETGYARPDIVLNDLTKIFHPEIMIDHHFYFFKKLY